MEKYHVVIKSYDNKDDYEVVTEEPVEYRVAVLIEKGLNININQARYYTTIEKA